PEGRCPVLPGVKGAGIVADRAQAAVAARSVAVVRNRAEDEVVGRASLPEGDAPQRPAVDGTAAGEPGIDAVADQTLGLAGRDVGGSVLDYAQLRQVPGAVVVENAVLV